MMYQRYQYFNGFLQGGTQGGSLVNILLFVYRNIDNGYLLRIIRKYSRKGEAPNGIFKIEKKARIFLKALYINDIFFYTIIDNINILYDKKDYIKKSQDDLNF